MDIKFKIKGIDCARCAMDLERVIEKIDGVDKVNINFMTEKMELRYNGKSKDELMKTIEKVLKKEEPRVRIEKI